ncbi:hypothetical protein [Mycobacterium avium]|uniref:hypothetical protein n=1 Tax=Mycobacterium avium TaxID=1764 RepID=UPI0003D1F6AA|nr:hypothetical protein [Mycobacterium avium]ETB27698.1 hypothetical protein O971_16525 [Mycobacterium avium subsp. hominissuis 10-4249]KDO98059.1 hypothetical protein MAVA5_05285 [Mycobacterium avium subsp. hominissuis A5]
MNEILRRVSEPRLPMPEYKSGIRALSDLGLSELQRLHDRLSVVAALEGADGEDSAAARWWDYQCRRVAATVDARQAVAVVADKRFESP